MDSFNLNLLVKADTKHQYLKMYIAKHNYCLKVKNYILYLIEFSEQEKLFAEMTFQS